MKVIVIGGGIVGVSCAYYLNRGGYEVTVIDQGKPTHGCSHANCGYVCPSHVLPLTEPGALQTALKSMFSPNAPFRVKARWDPALWSWLLGFARRCNHRDMIAGGQALKPILHASMEAYRELLAEEKIDCEWKDKGLLYVSRTEAGYESFAHSDDLLKKHFEVGARRLNAQELQAFEPALKSDLIGGFLYEDDAMVNPEALNAGWLGVTRARGVTYVEDCSLESVVVEGGKVAALKTSQGDMKADVYVLALGAWAAKWAKAFRCRLPIQPGKGYSLTLETQADAPTCAMLFPEHRVGVTPMAEGIRLGSIMEFAGYDTSIPESRMHMLQDASRHYLKEPLTGSVQKKWFGWRPMTVDSIPIIGPAPELANVQLAVGHNMIGLSLAAATGKLVAELLSGGEPHIDPAPYSPARFS